MLITKILETSIDLLTVEEIFEVDVAALLKRKLTERYEHRCFSSMLILEILEIIRYSDRIFVDNRLDGSAYINVQFKVSGIQFIQGEVIQGCRVISVADTGIIVSHPYAHGMIAAINSYTKSIVNIEHYKIAVSVLKVGQVVPVIVDDVRYNPGKSQFTMRCLPYIPQGFPEVYYNITDMISTEDTEKLESLLGTLAVEEKIHENIRDSKSYEFFSLVVYPYKTAQNFKKTTIGSKFTGVSTDLKEILKINSGCLTGGDFAQSSFLWHSGENLTGNSSVNGGLYPAISTLLLHRLHYLTTLRGFVEQYSTVEKSNELIAYWKICNMLKS